MFDVVIGIALQELMHDRVIRHKLHVVP